jgi:hypothetical protein
MQRIEKNDKWLLNTSFEQIFLMIKVQTEKFIEAPQMMYFSYIILQLFIFNLFSSQFSLPQVLVYKFIDR